MYTCMYMYMEIKISFEQECCILSGRVFMQVLKSACSSSSNYRSLSNTKLDIAYFDTKIACGSVCGA